MNSDRRLPTPHQALQFDFPDDFWLQMVEGIKDNEDKSRYVDSAHLINGDGKVVCNCALHPLSSQVRLYTVYKLEHRYLLCADSIAYLRRLVFRFQRKAN